LEVKGLDGFELPSWARTWDVVYQFGFCFFLTALPTPAAYSAQLDCAAAGMDNPYSQAPF
jgi:hypothetical protein